MVAIKIITAEWKGKYLVQLNINDTIFSGIRCNYNNLCHLPNGDKYTLNSLHTFLQNVYYFFYFLFSFSLISETILLKALKVALRFPFSAKNKKARKKEIRLKIFPNLRLQKVIDIVYLGIDSFIHQCQYTRCTLQIS